VRSKGPRLVSSRDTPRWASPGHALRPKRPRFEGAPGIIAMLILFAGAIFLITRLDPLPPRFTGEARASDGDSLRVGGDRVRLLGLDAPELDQVCWTGEGAEWPCGREARTAMAALLARGSVECATSGEDKFGRFLATCEVGGADLGAAMVEAGLAISNDDYAREESRAREAKRGIWGGRFANPREWRDEGPSDDPGIGFFDQLWIWLRELTGARSLR
jgi:endonuclease YncB( thermonuclease family)